VTQVYNITVRAGNSGLVNGEGNPIGLQARFLEGDPPAPQDLTGDEFVFRVYARGQEVLRKDNDTGDVTVDLITAIVTVPVSVADSRVIEAAGPALVYDFERRQAGGIQRTVVYGAILVEPAVNDD